MLSNVSLDIYSKDFCIVLVLWILIHSLMKLHKIVQRLKYILNKVFMSVCACGCIFLNLSEMKITSHQKQVCITSGLCSGRSLLLLSTNDQENISAAF